LIADGMSLGTLTCADELSQLTRGRGLTWMRLYNHPAARAGFMNMRSLNSTVTDSSAASSSWGSGTRIMNGKVNQMRDGRNLTTLYELFAQAGWRRGLVSTTEITHATPAGFAANVDNREKGELIASQYLDRRVDILLGGGRKFFDPKDRKDKRDLLADFRYSGYVVMRTLDELKAAETDRRWLGVFDASHLPYTLDHKRPTILGLVSPARRIRLTTSPSWRWGRARNDSRDLSKTRMFSADTWPSGKWISATRASRSWRSANRRREPWRTPRNTCWPEQGERRWASRNGRQGERQQAKALMESAKRYLWS
jgi:alkaline phosphatase